MIVRFGNHRLIKSVSLIIPPGIADIWIEVDESGWAFRARVVLERTGQGANIATGAADDPERGEYGLITLTDWDNTSGLSTRDPVLFVTNDDDPNNLKYLYFSIYGQTIGQDRAAATRKLEIQFTEAANVESPQ